MSVFCLCHLTIDVNPRILKQKMLDTREGKKRFFSRLMCHKHLIHIIVRLKPIQMVLFLSTLNLAHAVESAKQLSVLISGLGGEFSKKEGFPFFLFDMQDLSQVLSSVAEQLVETSCSQRQVAIDRDADTCTDHEVK